MSNTSTTEQGSLRLEEDRVEAEAPWAQEGAEEARHLEEDPAEAEEAHPREENRAEAEAHHPEEDRVEAEAPKRPHSHRRRRLHHPQEDLPAEMAPQQEDGRSLPEDGGRHPPEDACSSPIRATTKRCPNGREGRQGRHRRCGSTPYHEDSKTAWNPCGTKRNG